MVFAMPESASRVTSEVDISRRASQFSSVYAASSWSPTANSYRANRRVTCHCRRITSRALTMMSPHAARTNHPASWAGKVPSSGSEISSPVSTGVSTRASRPIDTTSRIARDDDTITNVV